MSVDIDALFAQLDALGVQVSSDGNRLKVDAPVGALTEGLAQRLRENKDAILRALVNENVTSPFEFNNQVRVAPASSLQRGFWAIDKIEGGSSAYNEFSGVRFYGNLQKDSLHRAMQAVTDRHDVLRTEIGEHEGDCFQRIHGNLNIYVSDKDLSNIEADDAREAALRSYTDHFAMSHFDLSQAPLWRAALVTMSDQEHVFLLVMHHSICDAWSMGVLVKELAIAYQFAVRGAPINLSGAPMQYGEYARAQEIWLASREGQKHVTFWRDRLDGAPDRTPLPVDPKALTTQRRADLYTHRLSSKVSSYLDQCAKQHATTLFNVYSTLLALLLSRLSGQKSLVLGTPVTGRERPDLASAVGGFINVLGLRFDFDYGRKFSDLLKERHVVLLKDLSHRELPFEAVVEALNPVRDLDTHPIFQALFIFQDKNLEFLVAGQP